MENHFFSVKITSCRNDKDEGLIELRDILYPGSGGKVLVDEVEVGVGCLQGNIGEEAWQHQWMP